MGLFVSLSRIRKEVGELQIIVKLQLGKHTAFATRAAEANDKRHRRKAQHDALKMFEGQLAMLWNRYPTIDDDALMNEFVNLSDIQDKADAEPMRNMADENYFEELCKVFALTVHHANNINQHSKNNIQAQEIFNDLVKWIGPVRWQILYPQLMSACREEAAQVDPDFDIDLRGYADIRDDMPMPLKQFLIKICTALNTFKNDLAILPLLPKDDPHHDARLETELNALIPAMNQYLAKRALAFVQRCYVDPAPAATAPPLLDGFDELDFAEECRQDLVEIADSNNLTGDALETAIIEEDIILTVMLDMFRFHFQHHRARLHSEGEAYLLEHPSERGTPSGFIKKLILSFSIFDSTKPAGRNADGSSRGLFKPTAKATTLEYNFAVETWARKKALALEFQKHSLDDLTQAIATSAGVNKCTEDVLDVAAASSAPAASVESVDDVDQDAGASAVRLKNY